MNRADVTTHAIETGSSTSSRAPRPAPAPAPLGQRILAHTRFETRILLSNGEQLMVAVLMPALVLIGMRLLPVGRIGGIAPVDTAVCAAFATAIISTSFTSQAIQTGFDRRYGVLRWIATTPLGRGGYLAGKILATLGIQILQAILLGVIAVALGWRPDLLGVLSAIPVWLLGTAAFGALGLLVAGTLRTEGVLAVSNILFVLFVAVGGIAVPASSYPRMLAGLVDLLPSGALGALLRTCLAHTPFSVGSVLVLAAWAIGGVLAVVRWFRWTSV